MRPVKHLALFRGVNVGGKNKLPMKELAILFADAGCAEVQTYIQSGNVIFTCSPKTAAQFSERIAAQVHSKFGFHSPIVIRTVAEMCQVISQNPFLKAGTPEETLHVLFLATLPAPGTVALLDPKRSPPDEFIVLGRHIYLRLPNGAGNTKLTNNYFDSKLQTISTGRNWRTVTKLTELMEA